MSNGQFADISAFQPSIDWQAYKQWASQSDGKARVAMKATEGRGFKDPSFDSHRAGALGAGIDQIFYYHFGRPDLNDPISEADWFLSVVGSIRPQDSLWLDIETNASGNIAEWCFAWLFHVAAKTGRRPGLYSYDGYISSYLQDSRLADYPLWYALWSYSPDSRPPAPAPWSSYDFLQYSDRGTVPGISGIVDTNVCISSQPTGGTTDMPLQITDQFAAAHFTELEGGKRWHCTQTNIDIAYGILDYYRFIQGAPRLPLAGEQYDIKDVVYQVCEAGIIVYDPQNILPGKPLGAGDCYLETFTSDLGKRILSNLISTPTVVEKIPDAVIADIKALQAAYGQLAKDAGI